MFACMYVFAHAFLEIFLWLPQYVCICVCGNSAILHGDSIPRLWLSTRLSLAVTSHHLPVTETAEERAVYEQLGDGGSPDAE